MELIKYIVVESEEKTVAMHTVHFTFAGKKFMAKVIETQEETYVQDSYVLQNQDVFKMNFYEEIDIPSYFGIGFKSEIFNFLYKTISPCYEQAAH